jgi:hypothetical protein
MNEQSKAAYVAGFMDGEGSFSIVKTYEIKKRKDGTKNKRILYHIKVTIANTNKKVLDWISSNFGGTVYEKKSHNSKWKTRYDWFITKHSDREKFILAVLPYLQIKREQALVALEFERLNGQECLEKRAALRDKMLKLNNSSQPHFGSPETNTLNNPQNGLKIESELTGDCKSALSVMANA